MEEKVIKGIPPIPLGLMTGAISAVMAFLAAIVMVVFMIPYLHYARGFEWIGGLGGLWALVVPVAAFAGGFIHGVAVALVYNFLASRIGGIRLRFG